ncbi:MAG: hypothetical protein LBE75_04690 [Burkholderiales bacterium]|jgi:hypothetical protein|nr:hypothetical protein [Burkholderiales bacterium]
MTDASPSSPTARELLDSVDALMRRNRRPGGTAPLPPPEGHIVWAAPAAAPPPLSVEIEAVPEAESVREASPIESGVPVASPLLPEPFEPLPEAVSGEAIIGEAKEEAAEQAAGTLPEEAPESVPLPIEDDLLLWDFVPRPPVAVPETETAAVPELAELEETKSADDVPVSPAFSEVVSFLSAPEVLASPSQGAVSYVTAPPTVTFDGVETEEAPAEAEAVLEILPEVSLEEAAFSEEAAWLPIEETDETPADLDAETVIEAMEALLSRTEAAKIAEEAKKIPQPAGMWFLVEPDASEETEVVSEAPEETTAAEGIEKSVAEEAALAETPRVLEASQEPESAEVEEAKVEAVESVGLSVGLTEPVPEETPGGEAASEEIVLPPMEEMDEAELDEAFFAEPEMIEPVATLIETAAEGHSEAGVVAITEEVALETPAATPETGAAVSVAGAEPRQPTAVLETGSAAPAEPERAAEPLQVSASPIPAPPATEKASPASAAVSGRQEQAGEAKALSTRYSAAQLLTEFQHHHLKTQNVEATAPAKPSPPVLPASAVAFALTEAPDSLLSLRGEPTREPVKLAEKAPPPVAAPKGPPLELTLVPLDGDAGPLRFAAPKSATPAEDDYYPVLTDVVDEDELPASSKA